jgi:putative ABC transport system permease protein
MGQLMGRDSGRREINRRDAEGAENLINKTPRSLRLRGKKGFKMGILDLLSLVWENLARRKGRVALTAVGVIIGTAAVVLLVSLGNGLQQNAASQLGGIGDLTKIQVWPNYGEWDPETGEPSSVTLITDQTVVDIGGIPGVTAVIPQEYFQGWGFITVDKLEGGGQLLGAGTDDLTNLGSKAPGWHVAAGTGHDDYWIGRTAKPVQPRPRPGESLEPLTAADLLDKQVSLVLVKWNNDGTETRKTVRLRIAGVIAESRDEPDWSMYISLPEMTSYNTWVQGKPINRNEVGYPSLVVRAAAIDNVIDVTDQIVALGYQAFSPQSFVEGISGFYTILQIIFGGVGAIALLVAASALPTRWRWPSWSAPAKLA